MVGAGARSGSDTVRLGSDLGDTGRIGDDVGRAGNDAPSPNRAPGGTANNLPTNSVDNGTPGGGPRGGQGGGLPANSVDGATGTGDRDIQGASYFQVWVCHDDGFKLAEDAPNLPEDAIAPEVAFAISRNAQRFRKRRPYRPL
ncbi:hypothetical protein ACH4KT_23675 [Streptomyces anulatus]